MKKSLQLLADLFLVNDSKIIHVSQSTKDSSCLCVFTQDEDQEEEDVVFVYYIYSEEITIEEMEDEIGVYKHRRNGPCKEKN